MDVEDEDVRYYYSVYVSHYDIIRLKQAANSTRLGLRRQTEICDKLHRWSRTHISFSHVLPLRRPTGWVRYLYSAKSLPTDLYSSSSLADVTSSEMSLTTLARQWVVLSFDLPFSTDKTWPSLNDKSLPSAHQFVCGKAPMKHYHGDELKHFKMAHGIKNTRRRLGVRCTNSFILWQSFSCKLTKTV